MISSILPHDFWSIVLDVGILATFVTTVFMIVGFTPGKQQPQPARHEHSPLRTASASAALERAAASARAKASATGPARTHVLTDVREVTGVVEMAVGAPAGQSAPAGDVPRSRQEPAVTAEEAEAIIAHYAEHEPNRLAEVIIQWIKSDVKNEVPRSR